MGNAQPGGFGPPGMGGGQGFGHGIGPGYGPPGQAGQWPGAMDPQVTQWFQAVDTDRTGRISDRELQQALVNANCTQFTQDTCRLMIGMFDRDMTGTLDVNEFQSLYQYIQQWRTTFTRYDTNRSGSIEAPELHSAYQQMGFNVSQRIVQTVLYKFDFYNRRTLTLDTFMQSCVLLRSLTDAFRQRDTNMSGVIPLQYEDFVTMCIMYRP